MDDSWIMGGVVMDDGGWIAFLVLGVLAAFAVIRLVLRHYFPPDR
jgi:hypothetical protein